MDKKIIAILRKLFLLNWPYATTGSSDRCTEKSCRGEVYTECYPDMVISHINLSSTTDDRCSVPQAYGHGENYIWVVRCAAVFQVCGGMYEYYRLVKPQQV